MAEIKSKNDGEKKRIVSEKDSAYIIISIVILFVLNTLVTLLISTLFSP